MENKNFFSVKCRLLAFNIVALGPVVSLELFVSRAYVASSSETPAVALLRESYMFLKRCSYVSSINLVKLMFLKFDE